MAAFRRKLSRICVYCGSSSEVDRRWLEVARAMGRCLASRGIDVVFGGGRVGLMGSVADAAIEGGARVYGVIPEKLFALELGHGGVTELEVVDTMHTRKLRMAELSDGFVALPGGLGTLEEIFEAATWTQLGYHNKPVGLLNAFEFYEPLRLFLSSAADERFIRAPHRDLLQIASAPEELIDKLETCELPTFEDLARRVRPT